MIYTTYEDMAMSLRRNLWKVPHDISLIVGIPRSGMIPALMLSELMNVRCTDIDTFIDGRMTSVGDRGRMIKNIGNKVLVIDDTVYAGRALKQVRERLEPLKGEYDIIYCCVFAEGKESKQMVDLWLEDLYLPGEHHRKEWNILHVYPRYMKESMWDIDGLVCKDPPEDTDLAAYESYLPAALPMVIPSAPIGAFVTYRLEKYRTVTEQWLQRQGIEYGSLQMFPAMSRDERSAMMSSAKYKAKKYIEATWAKIFYESSQRQAEKIWKRTGKPVFCYENGKMYL